MSITIPGVPETITREQYMSLVRAVGIEPERIQSLTFEPDAIRATVLVRGGGLAKHSIVIRVEG